MNTGQKTIEWLYSDQLRVDPEWSVKDANGFTWWADKNAQRVEVRGTERNENGDDAYFIGVETEFLRNVKANAKSAGSSGTRVAESDRKMIPFVRLRA